MSRLLEFFVLFTVTYGFAISMYRDLTGKGLMSVAPLLYNSVVCAILSMVVTASAVIIF
jgi:hypothetical protein